MADSSQWVPLATASISAGSNTANTKRIIKAQTAENEKMRQYNAEQARLQNEWNLQQWQRENAALKAATESERGYNSPAAQKARMVAAGLNPDMMYGGSGSVATSSAAGVASSPQMVASDYGNTVDWSLLRGTNTIGSAIMETLAIEQARANIKKTEGEAKQAGINADILDKFGIETADLNKEKVREEVNKLSKEAEGIDYSNSVKKLEHSFAQVYDERIVQNWLQRLESSTQMSKNELKEDIETLTLRIAGVNAENSRLERMSNFTTSEWRLVFDVVREILSFVK